ncbi:MAG: 2,3-bisphosphoglycerate-independent phosphoglycerate mutase [Aigarchaeota archaeon]|nr:2,3-bisphosphoglycerate-independent phosphoglycerate mutase [Aigarchaeota archaeon]MCX8193126.1 2,3-bisphosphoglycerate-independent phosphoglycerate mutase [Nitrososphaeria archaeon]
MKTVLIVCDGMADRPTRALKGLTPLQAAHVPTFDRIASLSECGIMDLISPGQPPGSDTAHLAIFGYDPEKYYSGRGAYEALGAGIDLKPGDVAFRCNFATVNEEGVIIDRRAGRISSEEAKILAEALKDIELEDVKSIFISTTEHRGVLVLRGEKLSRMVSDVDLHKTGVKIEKPIPLDSSEEAKRTAKILEEFITKAKKVLEEHELNKERVARGLRPANILLPRGAGTMPNVKNIEEVWGIKGAAIAGGALYKGVAKALGFKLINVPGATGGLDTNLKGKVDYTINALKEYDLVFLHIKATDTVSHDKDPVKKKEVVEWISRELTPLIDLVEDRGYYLVLTADHTTPSEVGDHRGDPVPIAIMGPDVRRDSVERFDEISCAKGGLNRIRGIDLMKILMNYLGKVPLFGE